MRRDIIICIIVVIFIVILNYITSEYTSKCVEVINGELVVIERMIKNDEEVSDRIKNIKQEWYERYKKLAYYIEHDELEKVHLYLVGLESGIEMGDKEEAIEELDKCKFILQHIETKYTFSLENIF